MALRFGIVTSPPFRRTTHVSKLNAMTTFLIRSPILWGAALSFGFFGLVHMKVVTNPLVIRYLAGHWVEYVEVAMFFVGLAALVIKGAELRRQRRDVGEDWLEPIPEGGRIRPMPGRWPIHWRKPAIRRSVARRPISCDVSASA